MVSVRLGCEVVKTDIAVYKKRESGAQHNRSLGSVVPGCSITTSQHCTGGQTNTEQDATAGKRRDSNRECLSRQAQLDYGNKWSRTQQKGTGAG